MEQWQWLVGIIVVVMVLWLIWNLSRNRIEGPSKPDLDMPRPLPRPVEPKPSPAIPDKDLTAIGLPKAEGPPDNLLVIKGVGPRLNTLLGDLGVTRFDQIAAWTGDDIARIDAHLGTFEGRVQRDNWVEQAQHLARGDTAGFEAKFGKLGE